MRLPNMNKYLCNTFAVVILILATSSCTRVGPDMMYKDRFDYTTAVGDSWKEQVLLNIVRIRYSDFTRCSGNDSQGSGY